MMKIRIFFLSLGFILSACTTAPTPLVARAQPVEIQSGEMPINFAFPLSQYKRLGRGYNGKHKGIDVSAAKGTPIYSAESGWITYQGRRFKGYGKLVIVEHSQSWATFYAHMSRFEHKEGSWVDKGDIIGYVGSTGRSTAPHLHFEIRFNNTAVDPMPYFKIPKPQFAGAEDSFEMIE